MWVIKISKAGVTYFLVDATEILYVTPFYASGRLFGNASESYPRYRKLLLPNKLSRSILERVLIVNSQFRKISQFILGYVL